MNRDLVISGFGAITPVGLSALQTCGAIRAALSNFSETGYEHKPTLEPVVGAEVPLHPAAINGHAFSRLVAMAVHAIQECWSDSNIDPSRTALLMGIREPHRVSNIISWRPRSLRNAVEKGLNVQFNSASKLLETGNIAAFQGLAWARELLSSGKVDACIVGGVDSYLNDVDLRRFGTAHRLKKIDVARGFIPGEAASFVAVTTKEKLRQKPDRAEILGVGLAKEDEAVTVLSDGFPTGKGMQRAFEALLHDAKVPEKEISFRLSDLNGEHYRSIDSMLSVLRCYRSNRDYFTTWLPASSVGETGAAVGALMLIIASVAIMKGYAPGEVALCDASSDSGLRGACLIGKPTK